MAPELPDRLRSDVVELRPVADWDIPEILIAHQDDPGLAPALGLTRSPTGAQLGDEVDGAPADWAAGTLKLTLTRPGSNDCAGRLVIDVSTATYTVWVVPQLRGRGLARAAVSLAGDWLAGSAGIKELQCSQDRPRGG